MTPLPRILLVWLLRGYQLAISPFLGQNCRFYPTCSNYAIEAVRAHGALKGSALAAKRLCKCHPWHPGGLDPVPGGLAANDAAAMAANDADAVCPPHSHGSRDGCRHS